MTTPFVIDFAKDFSRYPGGRYISDGPCSAEKFRDQILLPAILKNESVVLNLNGTLGFNSAFLEEVFGGLVRKGFGVETILRLKIKSEFDPSLICEIDSFIEEAFERKMHK